MPAAFERADRLRAAGLSVAGYAAYEASTIANADVIAPASQPAGAGEIPDRNPRNGSLPLVFLLVCDTAREVVVEEFLEAELARRNPGAVDRAVEGGYSLKLRDRAGTAQTRAKFRTALERIKEHLAAGECYQVNYTQNLHLDFEGEMIGLYQRLRRLQPTAYSALIDLGDSDEAGRSPRAVLSLSPELFFEFRPAAENPANQSENYVLETRPTRGPNQNKDYILETRPMKGTAPRYSNPDLDRESRETLARDPKILAEHRMIVDLLRNDLGVHAKPGGVSLPEMLTLESHDTVHQMTSLVRAHVADAGNARLFRDIFPALFPCGSITGAPKRAARRIIADLEMEPRGVYTGAIGYASPERARFNVAIRTLSIDGRHASYGSGCGIVWDSEPEAEWEEYRLKQAFLKPALDDFALIETMLFDGVRFSMMREHLRRLWDSARHYHIPLDLSELLDAMTAFQSEHARETRRVRLTVDRSGLIAIESEPWPHLFRNLGADLSVDWRGDGPVQEFKLASEAEVQSIRLADDRVYSGDPFRRHKTTERSLYDRELAATRAAGFSDSLFLNERGEVVESTIANLLIHTPGDEWLTPAVDCGALPGVFLAALDKYYPGRVQRVRLGLAAARAAGRWYLVNSLRGAWPVRLE